ncbi:hypothetical protein Ga0074812_13329 [Parafrankia irregularis]|uniref:Uncharacterized protein n=1 Tax=Parafrankia irregularis TaxID=795642 RepID=A0A0S4QWB9_9ACTN|nr:MULTISPECIES: hypothetical protein [Parafrankia]MBE3206457.1 hypothetical protein [Parafrankia sp. CH37]CUU59905.1 hypothetical protein Ga0074812_13329 [Parafrankia irregularis]
MGSTGMAEAPDPICEHVQAAKAVYDYGQFYLYSGASDEIDYSEVVNRAISNDGIAQDGSLLIILSPHQNNFAMSLRVEQWTAQPPDDLGLWQEAFAASIDVDAFGLFYESATTVQNLRLEVAPGRYTALITGRGFVQRGWPGSTTPGDEWRVRLWPRELTRREPARLKSWGG